MRDLVVTENITLDGVIDASGGWFSVTDDPEVDQSDLREALGEQSAAADAVLLGRVTFEEMRGYWPEQTDDTTGVTDYLNRVSKYVVSGTLGDPAWEPTTVLPADGFEDGIRALKAEPGRDIVTTGSITLVHALIGAGLVDEYRLFVYPSSSAAAGECFPTGRRSRPCGWSRPGRSAPGSCSCATGRRPPEGGGPAGCPGRWRRWPGKGRGAGRSRPHGA
jgi:dihydrofolate reductase